MKYVIFKHLYNINVRKVMASLRTWELTTIFWKPLGVNNHNQGSIYLAKV